MASISAILMLLCVALGILLFLGGLAFMIVFIVKKASGSAGGIGFLVTAIVLMVVGLLFAVAPFVLGILLRTVGI